MCDRAFNWWPAFWHRAVTCFSKFSLSLSVPNNVTESGHILDLYCVRLLNAVPFCENYVKLYFDATKLEKGLNRRKGG